MTIQFAANLSLLFDASTPWAERCQRASVQGFRFAEVLFPYDQPAAQYRRWLDDAGLQAVLINTPVDGHSGLAAVEGAQQHFQRDIDQAIAVAQELGAGAIHVMAGRAEPGADVSVSCLLGNLEYALKRVEDTDLVLMLEALNHHDVPGYLYSRPEQVAAVLEALPSPRLRQQFDFYHTLREELSLMDELQRSRPFIGHVQLAHPLERREPDLHHGHMLDGLLLLAATGYQGYVGCEYHPAAGFEAGLGWLAPLQTDAQDTRRQRGGEPSSISVPNKRSNHP